MAFGWRGSTSSSKSDEIVMNVDVDIGCCHPKLMYQILKKIGVSDEYPYIRLFADNYGAWRSLLTEYRGDDDTMLSKIDHTKLYYGGCPVVHMPHLWLLRREIERAIRVILAQTEFLFWNDRFSERTNPEFSRISGILGAEEDAAR